MNRNVPANIVFHLFVHFQHLFHVCFDLRAIVNSYTGRLVEENPQWTQITPPCERIEIKSTELEKIMKSL